MATGDFGNYLKQLEGMVNGGEKKESNNFEEYLAKLKEMSVSESQAAP